MRRRSLWVLLPWIAAAAISCASSRDAPDRPNVLWVVWDTVRADRTSLYGHDVSTTPHLDQWARGARVFEDAVSAGASTVPSHGSMFTGLLPTEHGVNNTHRVLDDRLTTIAERLGAAGYQTYLFAANPHISSPQNFAQGFDREVQPEQVRRPLSAADGFERRGLSLFSLMTAMAREALE